MSDLAACPTWGAEIRSILHTAGLVISATVAYCAAITILWFYAIGERRDRDGDA
jgi:hypothetical protein